MSEPTTSATTARACLSCVEACERRIEAFQASGGSASAAYVRACRDCIDACLLAARLRHAAEPPRGSGAGALRGGLRGLRGGLRGGGLRRVRDDLPGLHGGRLLSANRFAAPEGKPPPRGAEGVLGQQR